MSPSAGRVVPQKVNFWGQGNKEKGSPRLPLGEERTNILLLACCYQEGSNPKGLRIGGGADSGLCFLHVADADEEHVVGAGNVRGRLRSGAFLPSRIFLLGAAGEQEENGLGASASGPADLTQKMSPSAVESCPRRRTFGDRGLREGSPRLPLGEERANILLLACCCQEGFPRPAALVRVGRPDPQL